MCFAELGKRAKSGTPGRKYRLLSRRYSFRRGDARVIPLAAKMPAKQANLNPQPNSAPQEVCVVSGNTPTNPRMNTCPQNSGASGSCMRAS